MERALFGACAFRMWIPLNQVCAMDGKHAGTVAEVCEKRLKRLRNRESDAWEELITETQPRLYNYVLYSVPTPEDANDLLSEIYLAALRSISTLDCSESLPCWLYGIARRKVADFLRYAQKGDEVTNSLPDQHNDISFELREALATLPAPTRQALLLHYREGLNVEEVSHLLGQTCQATESLLNLGRAMLTAALGGGR